MLYLLSQLNNKRRLEQLGERRVRWDAAENSDESADEKSGGYLLFLFLMKVCRNT